MDPSPKVGYLVFSQPINADTCARLIGALALATQQSYSELHLAMNSSGGSVADGIALYNMLLAYPLPVTVYNIGSVSSIATIIFLGAPMRVVSQNGLFMVHRSAMDAANQNSDQAQARAEYLRLEDDRTDRILRENLSFDDSAWDKLKTRELYIAPDEAVRIGLAGRIGEFSVPQGFNFFTI